MALTGFGPGGKFLTAAPGYFSGGASAAGGKGVLAALGLSNPVGWAFLGAQIGLALIRKFLFKPKIEPLPVKSVNITGGREIARYMLGRRRVELEWTDATTLPGGRYRDNHKRFIACVSEGACQDITGIWVDQEDFEFLADATDATHLIPQAGSQFRLPPGDVTQYGFPTSYAFEIWYKFLANGTQSRSAQTTGRRDLPAQWRAPSNREYNGNPGGDNWGSSPTRRTTLYRDPVAQCASGYTLDYDASGNPLCRSDLDPSDTLQPNFNSAIAQRVNYALEVKPIDSTYALNGISWVQVDWFEPFYQQSDRSTKLYQRPPDVAVLMRGLKMTTPDSPDTPVYTANPAAMLYWLDTVYRGIPASRIHAPSYRAAFDHCAEKIRYRYGTGAPAASLGANGEYYARSNNRIYEKRAGAWVDLGEFQGDYDWLASQGTSGLYEMPRYECHLELEIGTDIEDVYEKILASMGDGRRYEQNGTIRYRAGVARTASLHIPEADIWEVGDFQPWVPIKSRVNKLSARLSQSEENDWLPDDIEFSDAAAIARDGETREAQYALDSVTNPIQAANVLKIQLGLLRTAAVWPVRVGELANQAQRGIEPLDTLTVTHSELGWSNELVQVIGAIHLRDRSTLLLLRRYDATTYAPTLTLPGIARRPVRFATAPEKLPVTSLAGSGYAVKQTDGTVVNHLVATFGASNALLTEVEYRSTSLWGASPSASAGIQYSITGLRAFKIAGTGTGSSKLAVLPGQTNRYGIWLQYQGPLSGHRVPFTQMAGQAILGTGSPLQSWRRFGIYASNAVASFRDQTLIWLNNFGTTGSNIYDFTTEQEANWRIVLRRGGASVYVMNPPQPSEDPDNPYIWDDGTGLRGFLEAAWDADEDVDLMVVDTSVEGIDIAALRTPGAWQPMTVAENRAEIAPVREGFLYDIRARHIAAESGAGPWAQASYRLTGDLTPPGVPTGKVLTPRIGTYSAEWVNATDRDIAITQVGVRPFASSGMPPVNTPTGGEDAIEIVAEIPYPGNHFPGAAIEGALGTSQGWAVNLRHVDRRGNRGAWDAVAYVSSLTQTVSGPTFFTGTSPPFIAGNDIGAVGDYYIVTGTSMSWWRRTRAPTGGVDGVENWQLLFTSSQLGTAGWAFTTNSLSATVGPTLGSGGLSSTLTVGTLVASPTGHYWEYAGGTSFTYRGNLRGDRGEKGIPGPPGITGERGRQGEPGPEGIAGPIGLRGERGRQGVPGPTGEPGDPGLKGEPGQQGVPGPTGQRGDPGIRGERGQQGLPGPEGPSGAQGIQGVIGRQGPPGGPGPPGARGVKGEMGIRGVQGVQGNPGAKGEVGEKGIKGGDGPVGAVGQKGSSGDSQFVFYSNAPSSTPPAQLVPVMRLSDGRWTTAGGTYFWYGDATQVPTD